MIRKIIKFFYLPSHPIILNYHALTISNSYSMDSIWIQSTGYTGLARVYGTRPAITYFNRCNLLPLVGSLPRPSVSRQSPNLGGNERAVLQAPCFQWHILSEQLQNFIAWNRILSTRNKIRHPHHSRYSDILYKREQRCLSRKYGDLEKRNKKKGETTRQNIQILLLF